MDAFIASSSAENQARVSLSQELTEYQQLRKEEKNLRKRVSYLEKQVALKGPLAAEVDVAMLLKEEKVELEMVRQTLSSQEEKIQNLAELPDTERTAIEAEKLEQLINDVSAKKAQLRILHDNVNFLEEKQAHYGIDVPLNLANELRLVKSDLEKVQKQLQTLETRLKEDWDFDPEQMSDFDGLDEQQIKELAEQIIQHTDAQKRAENKRIEEYRRIQADKYDGLVKNLLEDLKNAVYTNEQSSISRSHNSEWKLLFTGTFGGVHVSLNFDHANNPISWSCSRYHYNGHNVRTMEAKLSREDLISALKALHDKQKKWWQFWHQHPRFPDNWK